MALFSVRARKRKVGVPRVARIGAMDFERDLEDTLQPSKTLQGMLLQRLKTGKGMEYSYTQRRPALLGIRGEQAFGLFKRFSCAILFFNVMQKVKA
ncbi:MAG: hypothetical protein M5U26_29610 [Planctomycetota bacterium]|nr:hypothetical protein [Planctomycetota bacterium]